MNMAFKPPPAAPILSFRGVEKRYPGKVILRELDFDLPHFTATALVGPNGAGKSTVLRLIAGTEQPTRGKVHRWGRVSWPLGFMGGWDRILSGRDNVTFISRIYNRDPAEVADWVAEFAEIGRAFDMPITTYSTGMRQKLAFGLCIALDFDCYLIDEVTAVGDQRFQERCRQAFFERRHRSSLVMVSHSVATVRTYCESVIVLIDGNMFYFEDIEEGLAEYKAYLRTLETA